MINVAKFPRPTSELNGKNTPIPWVGGEYPEMSEWARVDRDLAVKSELRELCIVCGLKLSSDFVYMRAFTHISDRAPDLYGMLFSTQLPSPTWVHPKCAKIAALYCPHLKSALHPAQDQSGHLLTHADLTELARNSDTPGKAVEKV